jgi:DNA-binding IclR family transcriptional regulator
MAKDLGETVVLAAQNGPYMQYVYVASARPVEQLRVRVGMKRLMVCTAAGRSLLMSLDDPQVRQIARRNNSEADDLHRVSETTLIDRIGEEKARGYSESQGGLVPGINSISTLLDRKAFGKCLAIGVGGRAANIEKIKPKALDYLEDIRSLG